MASWKTWNEVPDSDEEEEDFESQTERAEDAAAHRIHSTPPSNDPKLPHDAPTDDSEDELALPGPSVRLSKKSSPHSSKPSTQLVYAGNLDTALAEPLIQKPDTAAGETLEVPGVQDLVAPPNQDPRLRDTAANPVIVSSPLTELSSSPPDTWENTQIAGKPQESIRRSDGDGEEGFSALHGDNETPDGFQRRSKRKRNAIQLNPYRIENQMYRQSIQRAGIAPVRIRQNYESEEDASDEYYPDQGRDTQDDGQLNGDSLNINISFEDEQPPDLESLLHAQTTTLIGGGSAGKNDRFHSRKRKRSSITAPDKQGNEAASTEGRPANLAIFEMPSPPPSSQSLREYHKSPKVFRYPPGITPPQLETPAVSSEVRSHHRGTSRRLVSDDEISRLSDAEDDAPRHRSQRTAQDSSAVKGGPNADSSSDEADVRLVRRRIKGVLPASWLRFDRQKQVQGTERMQPKQRTSSPPRPFHKGIARPLQKRMCPSAQQDPRALVVDDDSDPETVPHQHDLTISPHPPSGTSVRGGEIVDVSSDSMEEDHVDFMLPSVPRQSRQKKRHRIFHTDPSIRRPHHQTKISDHVRHYERKAPRRKIQRRDLSLSILDTVEASQTSPLPNFLRVALRTTKSRRDRGRQLPDSKFLQIEPAGRADDAGDILSQWKARTLEHFRTESRQYRQSRPPLQPLSGNERSKQRFSQDRQAYRPNRSQSIVPRAPSADRDTLENVLSRRGNHSNPNAERTRKPPKASSRTSKQRSIPKISSSITNLGQVLPGQLEGDASLGSTSGRGIHAIRFPGKQTRDGVADKSPILNRYLDWPAMSPQLSFTGEDRPAETEEPRAQLTRLSRKRRPERVPVSLPTIPSKYQHYPASSSDATPRKESDDNFEGRCLEDLGPYGHDYTCDFDIELLPRGSLVGSNGILGRGYIQRVLNNNTIGKDEAPPRAKMPTSETPEFLWGPWNEQVATDVCEYLRIVRDCCSQAESTNELRQRALKGMSLINLYVAESMHFLDSIDRPACLERLFGHLREVLEEMSLRVNRTFGEGTQSNANQTFFTLVCSEILVLTYQLLLLSHHEVASLDLKKRAGDICEHSLQITIKGVFKDGMSDLYQYQQALSNCSPDWVSDQCRVKTEALVIANHVSRLLDSSSGIWKYLQESEPFNFKSGLRNTVLLERKWFNLFAILPFLQVGKDGIVSERLPENLRVDGWSYVLKLLHPVLQMYEKDPHRQAPMLNEYYRALLGRCLVLINRWGWTDCEVVLRALYDAFARNNLHNLPYEESAGYPQLLTNFKPSSLMQDKSDKAFHVFMKIIGAGLSKMSEQYTEKRLRSVAFRLTPNHSRLLPKEESLRQEDLDALRNHHNLLCILYFVLPASCRPRLGLIQDLIRVEDSHRRACHISVRAWTDLTLFQISTQEPVNALQPLAAWYDDLLSQLVRQHALARKEVEAHEDILSAGLRDTMIASNQRQVEAVICDALHSLQLSIQNSKTVDTVNVLLTTAFGTVFALFNPRVSRTNSVLVEALSVVNSLLKHCETFLSNSESQDFGDWSAFEEFAPRVETTIAYPDWLIVAIHALLSSCLGSTEAIDDQFTALAVTTWASTACYLVKSGARQWNDFIDAYGRFSWFSFLQTDRTAKFTPMFLALIVEGDSLAYDQHQAALLRSWADGLVERESLLKYQARFTSAILNRDAGNPLLENPPFWRDRATDTFCISTSDLALRRRALISCVLSNMAEAVLFSTYHNLPEAQTRRHEYADLLKTMMKAMKDRYVALGTGIEVRGAYVEFVQEVAGLLQQHTNHIQPIDRFFLDAKNFPLPVHDPGYVVSRLKSYQLKIAESHGPKQLVAFVQTIAERAVVDGSQEYLTNQLRMALCNTFETGNMARPTLRAFILRSVLPAYVDVAVDVDCGWLVANPLLDAAQDVVTHILEDLDAIDPASVGAVLITLGTLLQRLHGSVRQLVEKHTALNRPSTARLLTLVYGLISATLRPVDYCMRLQRRHGEADSGTALVRCMSDIVSYATIALAQMLGRQTLASLLNATATATANADVSTITTTNTIVSMQPPQDPPRNPSRRLQQNLQPDVQPDPASVYAASGLRSALGKWTVQSDGTYAVRGAVGAARVVRHDLAAFATERDAFRGALLRFERTLVAMPSFMALVGKE